MDAHGLSTEQATCTRQGCIALHHTIGRTRFAYVVVVRVVVVVIDLHLLNSTAASERGGTTPLTDISIRDI